MRMHFVDKYKAYVRECWYWYDMCAVRMQFSTLSVCVRLQNAFVQHFRNGVGLWDGDISVLWAVFIDYFCI